MEHGLKQHLTPSKTQDIKQISLSKDDPSIRTAKSIIDDAIRENRIATFLLYVFSVAFVVVGLTVLGLGIWNNNALGSVMGTVASIMFWPAMTAARRTRKENIFIRLLEVPLSKSATADEASKMVSTLVESIFNDKNSDGK